MCYDLLGASVFRCVLLGTRRCGVSRVFTLVCHVLVISYCKHVLWWSGWLYLCKCGRVCDKETASGFVWRWRTSPQGVLFLVLHAHGQRCPLWDLWRGRRWKEGGRKVEEKGHGVRGERGCTRTASLSTPSRECPAEGVLVRVCWSRVHLERWRVCGSLAGLIKVSPRWNGLNSLADEPRLLVHAEAHCFHSSVPMAQLRLNRALNKYR